MANIARGISKIVAIKRETTYGVLAGNTGARQLRRVTAAFSLQKDQYSSEELRSDYQVADMRHGVRTADGSISGELSPGSYADLMAAALSKDFVAGVSLSAAGLGNLTVAGPTAGQYTITRSTGSNITDGVRLGDVIRIGGTGLNANVVAKNLLVTLVTATVLTVDVLNGSVMTPSVSTALATLQVVGKKSYVPLTGHTNDSFTVEEFFGDIAQSEVYTGVKVNTIGVSIPATGIATVDISMMGKDLTQTGTTQYFTSPTAASTSGILTGVNGVVVFGGTPVALITDASFNINRNISNATVLGSNSIAEAFNGRATVDGSMSIYFSDVVARDAFKDETEVSLIFTMTSNNSATSDFVSFTMPRCKVNSFTKSDDEAGLVASVDFMALLNSANGTADATTIVIQDSLA